jgi:hypothetical protein
MPKRREPSSGEAARMKHLLRIAATIIITLAMSDRASAEFLDGNNLYAKCTVPPLPP